MKDLSSKQIIVIAIVALFVISVIVIYFYKINTDNTEDEENVDYYEELEVSNQETEGEVTEKIIIHIAGCVKNQGIVVLDQGNRIIDAINSAGGTTEEADLNKLNLAYELQDGEKLYVPSKNEQDDKEIITEGENKYVSSSYNNEKDSTKSNEAKIININKATNEELQSLNGIGESMANKIIKYREENGKFNSIEDIKNVPGIGEAKFEGIKDRITVK